jgi:hypothetical protein
MTMALGGIRTGLLAVVLGGLLVGQPMTAAADDGFMLATGPTTGKSFAVGVGISSLAKVKLMPQHEMDLTAIESDGFVHNVRMLQKNQAQFAVLQAMFGHFVRTGTGTFAGEQPDDSIRAIAMLWRDADHFVMNRAYEKTGTIADLGELRGMPVSMGVNGPGPIESNRLLLSHLGIDLDQAFELKHLNYEQSAAALLRGEIEAMSTPIRPPAPHVANLLASPDAPYTLLSFTDEQIAAADGGLGLWTPYVIPAATYPGQDQDIKTVAKSNLLVVRADVDDEVVYQVTRAMFENLDFLRTIHDAMYETSLDRALVGMPMPLHPGALRYYQEVGLLGPDASLEVALADEVRHAQTAAYMPTGALRTKVHVAAASIGIEPAAAPADDAAGGRTFVVYFGLNEQTVNGVGVQELAKVSAYADNLTTATITVSGHTDRSGNPAYNARLAAARAQSVLGVLKDGFGVAGHEIRLETHGADAPVIDDGRAYEPRNRRVEITVAPAVAAAQPQQAATPESADDQPMWRKRASI